MSLSPSNSDDKSHKPPDRHGLMGQTLRGLRVTTTMTGLKTVVDVCSQLILVRLLFPEAFGVLAFLHSTAGFFCYLADWGGMKYIIQKKNLRRSEVNTVFSTELLVGAILAAIWLVGARGILHLFEKEYLATYVWLFAFWIVFERFQLPRSILEKEMKFGRSNMAMFMGVLGGSLVSVILAWRGCGVYSLILGLIFRSMTTAIFLWAFTPIRPRPGIDSSAVRPYLKFGLPLMLTSLFTFYYWNVDYIIVGRFLQEELLGYYYIAFKFPHYMLTLQALVSTVVYPAFSRTRDDEQLKRGFTLATKYSGALSLLPCVGVLVLGEGLVRYGLGEKWLPALRPFQIFTCLAAFRMITVHWYDVYLSKGKTTAMPFLSASNAIGVSLAAYIGSRYFGLFWVAIGVAVVNVLVILAAIFLILKKILKVRYLAILTRPLLAAGLTLVITLGIKNLVQLPNQGLDFAVKLLLLILVYMGIYIAIDHRSLRDLLKKAFS